ncbi:uncharacterized protein LOC141900149 [Tubulanus polymorphus]|uniref:uncharacterized protein LOC141900149 n=1 Tax=Tubulanus polymorphus TaxID=672921 RepID=UPI003DA34BF8
MNASSLASMQPSIYIFGNVKRYSFRKIYNRRIYDRPRKPKQKKDKYKLPHIKDDDKPPSLMAKIGLIIVALVFLITGIVMVICGNIQGGNNLFFYIVGGLLICGALVMLVVSVVKFRMDKRNHEMKQQQTALHRIEEGNEDDVDDKEKEDIREENNTTASTSTNHQRQADHQSHTSDSPTDIQHSHDHHGESGHHQTLPT